MMTFAFHDKSTATLEGVVTAPAAGTKRMFTPSKVRHAHDRTRIGTHQPSSCVRGTSDGCVSTRGCAAVPKAASLNEAEWREVVMEDMVVDVVVMASCVMGPALG